MRKPQVFLSHSKQDKEIIERLANDLRRARINVWYDEWEIPPGESFRRKIFQDGIPNCDLFFIYITPNSKDSLWVTRELDAAFIQETSPDSGSMAIFVDSDTTRTSLSPDIRALHSPILNSETTIYYDALANIISRTWEATSRKWLIEEGKKFEFEKLKLEKQIMELENQILRIGHDATQVGREEIILFLETKNYTVDTQTRSLKDIFVDLSNVLAAGVNLQMFSHRLGLLFGKQASLYSVESISSYDVVGELIRKGLLNREPATDTYDEQYSLSELGVSLSNVLNP